MGLRTYVPRTVAAVAVFVVTMSACSASDGGSSDDDASADRTGATSSADGREQGDGGTAVEGDSDKEDSNDSRPEESEPKDAGRSEDRGQDDGTDRNTDRGVDPIDDDDVPDTGQGQTAVLNQLRGDRSGACVDTAELRNVRSGGLAAGPFDEVETSYGSKAPGKPKRSIRVYWIPQHSTMPGLEVRISKVGGSSSTTITEKSVSDTSEWKFYDTYVPIESAGTWRLEATSGKDRGCFTVTVG